MEVKSCWHHCHLVAVLAIHLGGLFGDWYLYYNLQNDEKELVCSQFEGQVLINAQLAFSIIATLLFLFEFYNLYRHKFHEKGGLIHIDLATALTVCLEDIPQTIINFLLADCREGYSSVQQKVKAILFIFTIFVRVIIMCTICCRKSEDLQGTKVKIYWFFILLGLCFTLGGSIYIIVKIF